LEGPFKSPPPIRSPDRFGRHETLEAKGFSVCLVIFAKDVARMLNHETIQIAYSCKSGFVSTHPFVRALSTAPNPEPESIDDKYSCRKTCLQSKGFRRNGVVVQAALRLGCCLLGVYSG
jgi:hypothetical protein